MVTVDSEVVATDVVIVPGNDGASSKQTDEAIKSPSLKNTKQPKLCTTHFGKKECNFKPHHSPKTDGSRKSQEAGTVFNMLNMSAAVCSAVIIPAFFILFVSV